MQILLYKGRGLLSRMVRFQTRSEYSHAAILLDDKVVEATYVKGVAAVSVEKFKCQVDVFEVATTIGQDQKIKSFLVSQFGKFYDLTMCVRFFTRRQATRKTKGRWFCSELVFAAFQAAGIELFKHIEPWEVSPGLLARSPLLRYSRTIKP